MSDDISKVVAMLRDPPWELAEALAKIIDANAWIVPPDHIAMSLCRTIADYLDQHARTAPEADGRQAADAMRQVLANHAERKRAAASAKPNPPPSPESSEPSRKELIEALTAIGEFGGKTLIMATDDPHERSAYSLGAHRAFEQTANIARSILSRARGM